MDILFLAHRIPFPPNKGDKIRSWAILKHLAQRHRVHVACFIDDPLDLQYQDTVRRVARGECLFIRLSQASKLARACAALVRGETISASCFGAREIGKWLSGLRARYNIAHTIVFSSAVAPHILDGALIDPATAILDMVDVDSDKWAQYGAASRGLSRWLYQREARKLQALEREAVRKFGATTMSSPCEAQFMAKLAPDHGSRIFAVSNGVDLDQFSQGSFSNPFSSSEYPVVMTGRMDYRPNSDGAKWFAREVLPLIRRKLPNARFYAVGAYPPYSLVKRRDTDVVITGHVADIRPYIQHAAVVVAPLKIARGIQNKVLEAMALGRPVVATSAASQALAVTSGIELWIEDEPDRFAEAVLGALSGRDRHCVAQNGHIYVKTHHNWARNLSAIDHILAQLGQTNGRPNAYLGSSDHLNAHIAASSVLAVNPQ